MTFSSSSGRLAEFGKTRACQTLLSMIVSMFMGVSLVFAQQVLPAAQAGHNPLPEAESVGQLREDVQALRAEVERLRTLVAQGQFVPAQSTLKDNESAPISENSEQGESAGAKKLEPQSVEEPSDTRAAKYVDWRGGKSKISLFDDRVRLSGYGSVRFETNDVASGNAIPSGSATGFTFRRFVLATDAKPAPRIRVYSEIEYERLHGLESEKAAERAVGNSAFKQTLEGN